MKRALVLLLLLAPATTSAQSLFSARGLGVPIDPIDARARALGGIGVGLIGVNPALINPAELGGGRRGVTAVLQPTSHALQLGAAEGDVSASRFPLIGILYPVSPRLSLGLGYAGYLEQSWAVRTTGEVVVGGEAVEVEDVVQTVGGLGQIRASAAYALSESFAVGVAGGAMSGSLDRTAARAFMDSTFTLREFSTRLGWKYGGYFGSVGARWDVTSALRLGASALLSTELDADSTAGVANPRSYDGAMQLAAGASGRITQDLTIAIGAMRNRYPGLGDTSTDLGRETWTYGGGLEYEGLTAGRRTFPFRLGARLQQLPYYGTGEEPAREVSGTFGVGFRLAGDASGPLAVVDFAAERAKRTGLQGTALGDGMEESVWRWTFSLALFGR